MALEKTFLYNTDINISLQNIANYLNENAVPMYFDRVDYSTDTSNVVCYIGNLDFVTFSYTPSDIYSRIKIKINNGVIYHEFYCSIPKVRYVYYGFKTPYGISFTDHVSTIRPICTICKDNDNNTTVVVEGNLFINKSDKTSIDDISKLYTANTHTYEFPFKNYNVCSANLGITAAVPLFVGDTENYTPDVLLLVYSQNVSDGIIDINGVRYYSNGLWCVKIE